MMKSRIRGYVGFTFILLLLICGCAHNKYEADRYKSIAAFYKVNDGLYRGGKPDMDGLSRLKSMNIKSIINFQQDSDDVRNERIMAEAFGFNFYHIPLSVNERPADKQVLQFLDIVMTRGNLPVFVHCSDGRYLTGAIIAMYRVVVEAWTIKEAYQEAKALGFWPYRGETEMKFFIHQLKDKDAYFIKAGRQPIGR